MAIGVNLFYNSMVKAVPWRKTARLAAPNGPFLHCKTAHIAVPRGHVGKWLWHMA